jgi:hypothetical protein
MNCEGLTSYKGCPEIVGRDCVLFGNKKVTSLDGIPKEVGEMLDLRQNGKEFSEKEIKQVCLVKGFIA